jgi:hypothetical protein
MIIWCTEGPGFVANQYIHYPGRRNLVEVEITNDILTRNPGTYNSHGNRRAGVSRSLTGGTTGAQ